MSLNSQWLRHSILIRINEKERDRVKFDFHFTPSN